MNTPDRWLEVATADARARGREDAVPVLEAFARSMHVLRNADWNDGPDTVGKALPPPEQP